MTDDKTKLILKVNKTLWLAPTETIGTQKIFGWTTKNPSQDIGNIEKGSILIFTRLSPYTIGSRTPLEFMNINIGPVPAEYPVDFFEEEVDNFTKEGVLTLLDTKDIDELTISLTALGEIFIKYQKDISFDRTVFLPRDMYIIMGSREYNRSNGKIGIGEKISMQHLLDVYSMAIGQNLILK